MNMKFFSILAAVLFSLCASANQSAAMRGALDLYEKGAYKSAISAFEAVGDDPLAKAYIILCSEKLALPGCAEMIEDYESRYTPSILKDRIYFLHSMNCFNEGNYKESASWMDSTDMEKLPESLLPEYTFKRGYCFLKASDRGSALEKFAAVIDLPKSDYTAPSQFFIASFAYDNGDAVKAEKFFAEAASDPRFKSLSEFYLVECRFLQKDYDYVIEKGERIFNNLPEVRQERLSRLISESYLIKGDTSRAKSYLEKESRSEMTRSDYFHAGSVLYAAGDYDGAIDNLSKITERTDSLGQVANYNLGFAYIKKANKVAALEAFNDAASYDFDPEIKEDAAFNYAKLAFDINHDPNGFKAYIARYSTSRKGEQIYNYMALADLVNHDYQGAIEAYDNIEVLSDAQKANYVKANYLRASQLISSDSWLDAVPYLQAAGFYFQRSDPFNQLTRNALAEAYYRTGKYSQSRTLSTDLYNTYALQNYPEGKILAYNVASCYFAEENWRDAARWYDTYLASGDSLARMDALQRRADCDFLSKDYKAAAVSYAAARREAPAGDLYPLLREGISYGLGKDRKKKAAVLSEVLNAPADAPLRAETLYELGRARLDLNDRDGAREAFRILSKEAGDSVTLAKALIGLGMVERNAGNQEEALRHYKRVAEMMPGSEFAKSALQSIESIYQKQRRPELYLSYVESLREKGSDTGVGRETLLFNTAEQVYLAGNYPEAEKLLENFLGEFPNSAKSHDALFYLADSYRSSGDKEKALVVYSKVIESNPEGSFAEVARVNLAALSYSLERYGDALDAYRALLQNAKIESNKDVARRGILNSAYKARRWDDAVAAADAVDGDEARFIKAKSLLSLSRRAEALGIFKALSGNASTPEGAESYLIIIQDAFDRGDFNQVEKYVYDFSQKSGAQSYFLAKAYLVLGDSFAARGNASQARVTYESIRDGYVPASGEDDIQEDVKIRLEKLGDK